MMPAARRWISARPATMRVILGGPLVLIAAIMVLAAMPLWFPEGSAGIDHVVLPLILFPAVWAILFFYAVMARSLVRIGVVLFAVTLINGTVAVLSATGQL